MEKEGDRKRESRITEQKTAGFHSLVHAWNECDKDFFRAMGLGSTWLSHGSSLHCEPQERAAAGAPLVNSL